jgi:hypothetical protein
MLQMQCDSGARSTLLQRIFANRWHDFFTGVA